MHKKRAVRTCDFAPQFYRFTVALTATVAINKRNKYYRARDRRHPARSCTHPAFNRGRKYVARASEIKNDEDHRRISSYIDIVNKNSGGCNFGEWSNFRRPTCMVRGILYGSIRSHLYCRGINFLFVKSGKRNWDNLCEFDFFKNVFRFEKKDRIDFAGYFRDALFTSRRVISSSRGKIRARASTRHREERASPTEIDIPSFRFSRGHVTGNSCATPAGRYSM